MFGFCFILWLFNILVLCKRFSTVGVGATKGDKPYIIWSRCRGHHPRCTEASIILYPLTLHEKFEEGNHSMDLKNLRENHSKLIQYLKEHDYTIGYIACFKTVISVILRKSEKYGWSNYNDIYQYIESTYAPSVCRQYRSVLIAIREFDLNGKYPTGNRSSLFNDRPTISLCSCF